MTILRSRPEQEGFASRFIGGPIRMASCLVNCASGGRLSKRSCHAGDARPRNEKSQRHKPLACSHLEKWTGAGSNRRHTDFQSVALPTELPVLTLLVRNAGGWGTEISFLGPPPQPASTSEYGSILQHARFASPRPASRPSSFTIPRGDSAGRLKKSGAPSVTLTAGDRPDRNARIL